MKRSGRSRNWNQDIWLKDMQVLIAILSDWLLQMICDKNYKYSHFNPEILSYIFIHTVTIWWIHTDTHCSLVCESVDWKQKLDRSWLFRASLVAQTVKNLPVMLETQVQSLSQEYPLEEKMATPSSIFAWKTPWTEEPGRLQSMGSQRVGHYWVTNTLNWYIYCGRAIWWNPSQLKAKWEIISIYLYKCSYSFKEKYISIICDIILEYLQMDAHEIGNCSSIGEGTWGSAMKEDWLFVV